VELQPFQITEYHEINLFTIQKSHTDMIKKSDNQTLSKKAGSPSEVAIWGSDREFVPVEAEQNGLWVNSLLLHQKLGIATRHNAWMARRIESYGFVEGFDFCPKLGNINQTGPGRPSIVYSLTLTMAKELAMLENNKIGRAIRRYFIEVENSHRDWIGFILPRLTVDMDLFGKRLGYGYVQLLRCCGCGLTQGAMRSRINRRPQEFWKNQLDEWFVSEAYGKVIITNAIARKLNQEAKQRHLNYIVQKALTT
jgi:phage anti-repressor protein